MAKWSVLLFYLLQGLVHLITGQQQPPRERVGPWRQRIQWENNGKLYSLMSTGSEYQPPARPRSQSRVYMSTGRDGTGQTQPGTREGTMAHRRPGPIESNVGGHLRDQTNNVLDPGSAHLGHDSRQYLVPNARQSGARGTPPGPGPVNAAETSNEAASNGEDMVSDDPRNPFKNHRNSVFYNMYSSRGRTPVARTRRPRPPASVPGTRYFQNGLPDLVPDPYAIQAGAYIQRMQMYSLRCAAEENCLARSASTARDIDYRVLLRFPQKVKNQGTTDFLPVKPRHQWEWHSCHQHYHSMDAFSSYDLLDVITGRKVAEGHKASFCLEDTGCDAGFRRRYACTAHTQGLSPGCHDTYAADIDCQWIDITDVPAGNYFLRVIVNPSYHVQESDYSNNVVRCDITYTGTQVQTRNCRVTRG
ncbi:unnamed protein product [Oncorhynchus mykiss]|uniref:Lysyl oxidase homolog n=1 Tax=Oncorhynchus mykiss TaxID=8022 RepID=A0A060Y9D0_ONCMY|nr:unnamed protein product [Oncorhynchus mykiss]